MHSSDAIAIEHKQNVLKSAIESIQKRFGNGTQYFIFQIVI